jgi:AcrR family transcriptional regulator
MPKVSEQYRDARRGQILDAARRCFLRDGFHETSMQDLFAEVGLSSGAVYRYFASKDELIVAIVEDNLRDVVAMIHTVATDRPGGSIGQALADVIDLVHGKHDENGLVGLAVQVWAEALRKPALAKQFRRLLLQLHTDLVEVVGQHQQAGNLPADVPAEALASVLIGAVPGHVLQLAILGPKSVSGVPDALRALWPNSIDAAGKTAK